MMVIMAMAATPWHSEDGEVGARSIEDDLAQVCGR